VPVDTGPGGSSHVPGATEVGRLELVVACEQVREGVTIGRVHWSGRRGRLGETGALAWGHGIPRAHLHRPSLFLNLDPSGTRHSLGLKQA
jgi:hypothetical protein